MPVPGIDVLMYVPLFPVDALRPFPPTETPMPDFDRLRFTPLAIFTRFLKVHPMFYLFKNVSDMCLWFSQDKEKYIRNLFAVNFSRAQRLAEAT